MQMDCINICVRCSFEIQYMKCDVCTKGILDENEMFEFKQKYTADGVWSELMPTLFYSCLLLYVPTNITGPESEKLISKNYLKSFSGFFCGSPINKWGDPVSFYFKFQINLGFWENWVLFPENSEDFWYFFQKTPLLWPWFRIEQHRHR